MNNLSNYITEKLHLNKENTILKNEESEIRVGDKCCIFLKIEGIKGGEIIVPDVVRIEKITGKKYTVTYLTDFGRRKGKTLSYNIDNTDPPRDWVYRGFPTFQQSTKVYITLDAEQSLKILKKIKADGSSHNYYTEWLDLVYTNCPADARQRRLSRLCVHRHNFSTTGAVTFNSAGSMSEDELNTLIDALS